MSVAKILYKSSMQRILAYSLLNLKIKHCFIQNNNKNTFLVFYYCSTIRIPFFSTGSIPAKLDYAEAGKGTWNKT